MNSLALQAAVKGEERALTARERGPISGGHSGLEGGLPQVSACSLLTPPGPCRHLRHRGDEVGEAGVLGCEDPWPGVPGALRCGTIGVSGLFLHRSHPAPRSPALLPQECVSRRWICGEEPSGGAIFKGTILRPSFKSTTS